MTKPIVSRVLSLRPVPHPSQKALVNIAIQSRLRRDLQLNSAEINGIDIELAQECGLLTPAAKR